MVNEHRVRIVRVNVEMDFWAGSQAKQKSIK